MIAAWKDRWKNKPSLLLIALISIIALWNATNYNYWKKRSIISQDVIQYYSYLPAAFVKQDLALNFLEDKSFQLQENQYWHQSTKDGKRVFKYTCGEAVLIMPFFFAAQGLNMMYENQEDPYGPTYQLAILIAAIFYFTMGLIFIRRVLLLYFNEKVTLATILLITLGTNLYYYSTAESGMSHVYSFAMVSAFLYYTFRFHDMYTWKNAILVGLSFGMVILVRPSNAVILLFFVGFNISSWQSLIQKFEILKYQFFKLAFIATIAFAVFSLQMVYWKISTGNWIYYSYLKERFYFDNPHILETLLGFRKGLLIYSPILLFAFLGVFISLKKHRELGLPIILFLIVNIYVVSSWWCWWYGGSFGLRAYIDMYPVLAIGLAFYIQYVLKLSVKIQAISVVVASALTFLSCFQVFQYRKGIIHYDGMTAKAYFNAFFKFNYPANQAALIQSPNYDKAANNEGE